MGPTSSWKILCLFFAFISGVEKVQTFSRALIATMPCWLSFSKRTIALRSVRHPASSFTPAEICTLIRIRVRWPYAEVCSLNTCYLWHMKEFALMAPCSHISSFQVKVMWCLEHQSTALLVARALRPAPRRTFVQPERRAQYKAAARRSGRRTF